MKAKEYFDIIKMTNDYNPNMTPVIKELVRVACKEQRENCFKAIIFQIRDSVVEEKIKQLCENASIPEI